MCCAAGVQDPQRRGAVPGGLRHGRPHRCYRGQPALHQVPVSRLRWPFLCFYIAECKLAAYPLGLRCLLDCALSNSCVEVLAHAGLDASWLTGMPTTVLLLCHADSPREALCRPPLIHMALCQRKMSLSWEHAEVRVLAGTCTMNRTLDGYAETVVPAGTCTTR